MWPWLAAFAGLGLTIGFLIVISPTDRSFFIGQLALIAFLHFHMVCDCMDNRRGWGAFMALVAATGPLGYVLYSSRAYGLGFWRMMWRQIVLWLVYCIGMMLALIPAEILGRQIP